MNNVPRQEQPLLTLNDIAPAGYNKTIDKNNARVDFNKLKIPEDSCRIVKDILLAHPCKYMLTKSTSVPSFYLHQFWLTTTVNQDAESFSITLDRQVYRVDLEVLREVLLLPRPETDYAPMMSERNILEYLIHLGYDVQDILTLTMLSRSNVKYMS